MTPSPLRQAALRGVQHRCPNCGEGRLFSRYLKVAACDACGHDNTQYRSDDGPAYLTILLVGHLLVAPMLLLPFVWTWPAQYVLLAALPIILAATLVALPFVKGAFIGLQWSIKRTDELRRPAA